MPSPLLTLETLAPDPVMIVIDAVAYELAQPADFSLREEAENSRLLRKAATLLEDVQASKDVDLEPAKTAELEQLLGEFIAVILRAPEPVRARLKYRQQLAIVSAFTAAVSSAAATPKRAIRRNPSTLASSSRDSARRTGRVSGSRSRSASSLPSS